MEAPSEQARVWAAGGAMALTGWPAEPPLVAPAGVVDRMVGLGADIGAAVLALLGERAAIAGLHRQGDVSCGGTTRLVGACDGTIAVSLARPDVASLAAWLELDEVPQGDPWPVVARASGQRRALALVERGVLLGLPVAAVPDVPLSDRGPVRELDVRHAPTGRAARRRPLLPVGRASLRAAAAGARRAGREGRDDNPPRRSPARTGCVLRPAARRSPVSGTRLRHDGGRRRASPATHGCRRGDRGGAAPPLEQLGIDAGQIASHGPVWVSITAHGREGSGRDRVGFGDDAAAAGGLVASAEGGLGFVADAVADPLSGVTAAAARAIGLDAVGDVAGVERGSGGVATGRLWRLDTWLRGRVPAEPVDLAGVGRRLLARGVTAVTDATPTDDLASLQMLGAAAARGELPQRLRLTGSPAVEPSAAPELDWGPVKLLLPDHEPPVFDRVLAGVRAARSQRRRVAIHCVTATAAVLAVAALEDVGPEPGDRIEHGAVISVQLAERIAALGVTVVTNPNFVFERGEQYLDDVDDDEAGDLWRCRSLLERGVAVGGGTDAPFGRPDPWAAMAAAVDRRTAKGRLVNPEERLPARRAVDLFLTPLDRPGGEARRVAAGVEADLCLLAMPLREALAAPADAVVVATVVRGTLHTW